MATPPNPFASPEADLASGASGVDLQFSLRYKLSRWDYFIWSIHHGFRMLGIQVLAMGLAAFGAVAILPLSLRYWHLILIVMVAGYLLFWLMMVLYSFVLFVCLGKNRFLLTEHEVCMETQGLQVATKYVRSLHYWAGIDRVTQGPGFIAVYFNVHGAHILPSRAFSDPAHRAQFLSVLQARRIGAEASE